MSAKMKALAEKVADLADSIASDAQTLNEDALGYPDLDSDERDQAEADLAGAIRDLCNSLKELEPLADQLDGIEPAKAAKTE